MGIYAIKPRFQRSLRGVEGWLVRRRVHPDRLTFAALGLSVAGGAALWGSRWAPWLLLAVPVIAIGRTALNALDGLVARRLGLARPWGEVLNELADRAADGALFTGVALAPGSDARLGAVALVAMLLGSHLGNAAKAAGGRRQYGGVMAKADRMVLLAVAAPVAYVAPGLPILTWFLALVLVGLVITFLQRLRATYRDLESVR